MDETGCFSDSNLRLDTLLGGAREVCVVDYVAKEELTVDGADATDGTLVLLTAQKAESILESGVYCVKDKRLIRSAVDGSIGPGTLVVARKSRAVYVASAERTYTNVTCLVGARVSGTGKIVNDGDYTEITATECTAHTLTAKSLLTHSDLTLKTNVHVVDGAARVLEGIRGYAFDWADGSTARERQRTPGYREYGLVAQEVRKVVPSAVAQTGREGTLSVNYAAIVPLLVEAVRELGERVSKLEARA
jgi:hypothetical protein